MRRSIWSGPAPQLVPYHFSAIGSPRAVSNTSSAVLVPPISTPSSTPSAPGDSTVNGHIHQNTVGKPASLLRTAHAWRLRHVGGDQRQLRSLAETQQQAPLGSAVARWLGSRREVVQQAQEALGVGPV